MSTINFDGPLQCGVYVDVQGFLRVACQCGKCFGGVNPEPRISIQGPYATGSGRGCDMKLSSAVTSDTTANFTFGAPEAEIVALRDVVHSAQGLRQALRYQQSASFSEQADAWRDIHSAMRDFDNSFSKLKLVQK